MPCHVCCSGSSDVLQGEDSEPAERLQVGLQEHQGRRADRADQAHAGRQVSDHHLVTLFLDIIKCFHFRNELLYEMKEKAATMGANAVVGLKIEANSVFEGCLDMVSSVDSKTF